MKLIFIIPVLLLLFSGCITVPDEKECLSIDESEVLEHAAWGENIINTDKSVILRAKITCWHSVALGYAAKSEPVKAVKACQQLPHLSLDPADNETLWAEHNTCITAVAKRLRVNTTCDYIAKKEYKFEYDRCYSRATPPNAMCTGTAFILLTIGATLFLMRKQV